MEVPIYFQFAEYWWLYLAFLAFVLVMLALDLGVFHRKAHEVSFKEASTWSVVWVSLALLFNVGFYYYAASKFPTDVAWNLSLEFFTGYVVEKALSVDNIFVFVLVFGYFAVPLKYQHRVLFYGILGALFFRAIFIGAGSWLMQFQWIIYIFGAFLIITGIKMMLIGDKEMNPEKNPVIRLFKRLVPVTGEYHGQKFFVIQNKAVHATPLFVALLFIELTDIVFAVDSVPAIFAITKEPLIVFTSNIFAILGLRAMYFMLAGVIHKFYLLKYGLSLVLIFVGLKMVWLNDAFGGKFPIVWSLSIIASIISVSIVASLLFSSGMTKVTESEKEE